MAQAMGRAQPRIQSRWTRRKLWWGLWSTTVACLAGSLLTANEQTSVRQNDPPEWQCNLGFLQCADGGAVPLGPDERGSKIPLAGTQSGPQGPAPKGGQEEEGRAMGTLRQGIKRGLF